MAENCHNALYTDRWDRITNAFQEPNSIGRSDGHVQYPLNIHILVSPPRHHT